MRILIAAETYYPLTAGSAYATYRLANGLASRGHHVFVVSSGNTLRSKKTKEGKVEVFRVSSVPILFHKGYRLAPFAYRSADEIVKKVKPDIIHVQDHFFVCWAIINEARKMNIPIVGTNHFHPDNLLHYLKLPENMMEGLRKLAWKHFNAIYGRLDLITTPSETAHKIIKENGTKGEVRVISNGIDLETFKPSSKEDIKEVSEKYHLGDGKKILFVGRLEKEKNIDILIQALALMRKKVSNAKLFIAGFGSQEEALKELAKDLKIEDSLVFLGKVSDEDLRKIYGAVDVFATASTVELQGLVVMEAMASGRPIVSSVGMALKELTHDGVNGFIFPNGNYKAAAAKLVKVLSDNKLAEKMGAKSLELIQEHAFSKSLNAYEKAYKEAILKHKTKKKPERSRAQKIVSTTIAAALSIIVFVASVSATRAFYERKPKIAHVYSEVRSEIKEKTHLVITRLKDYSGKNR